MVRGYFRSSGTYVHPYLRSPPTHSWAAASIPRYGFTGTPGPSPIHTPTASTAASNDQLGATASEVERPMEVTYKPVFQASDHCKGHKLYGEKTGAAVCIIGGQDEAD